MGEIIDNLRSGHVHSLTNKEFSILFKQILISLEEVELKDAHLVKAFENARNQKDILDQIRTATYKHPITKEIDKLVKSRSELLKTIRHYAEGGITSQDENKMMAGNKVLFWLNAQKQYILRPGPNSHTHAVNSLVTTKGDVLNEGVDEALETTGAAEYFAKAVTQTAQINRMIVQRKNDIASMRLEVKKKRKIALAGFKIFFSALEDLANMPGESQEEAIRLSKDVREFLDDSRAIRLSRITAKRNHKESENSDQELDDVLNAGAPEASGDVIDREGDFSITKES